METEATVLKKNSISNRLQRINLLSMLSALAFFSIVIIISNLVINLNRLIDTSKIEARVFAESIAPSLLFSDQRSAQDIINTFKLSPLTELAVIYDQNDELFVSYSSNSSDERPEYDSTIELLNQSYININQPIIHQQQVLGHLFLRVSLSNLYRLATMQVLVTVITLLVSLIFGRYLLVRLSKAVLTPLTELATTMTDVSNNNDYNVRVEPSDIIELNILSNGLNIMLSQIQNRDKRLSEYSDNLEEKITLRTMELEKAKTTAEKSSQAKSEFLSNMSHEIRTPMNVILGMLHLSLQTQMSHQQKDWISKSHAAAENLLGIINDILDLSKVESGTLEFEELPFHIDELMDEVINLIKVKANEKGLHLLKDNELGIHNRVIGDALRLRQVLTNLMGNAVKFSHSGEISLKVELVEDTDCFTTLEFLIKDTGIGISQEHRDKLFQPFSQADNSISREFGGTGLGLVISKRIVEMMGGKIWLKSEPGLGSTFFFTIKLKKQHEELDSVQEKKETIPKEGLQRIDKLKGIKILLVEDNVLNQELFSAILKPEGIELEIANNGREALACLDKHLYDGVLMDCQMPVMDGYEATRQIRDQERFYNLPIIALTANAMKHDIDKALESGMNDHIAKPVDFAHMLKTISKWVLPKE